MSNPTAHPFDILLEINNRSQQRASTPTTALAQQPSAMMGKLALRLDSHFLMLSMDDIEEIIPLPTLTQVPGVKPWLSGIANLRGTVISVVSLGAFLLQKASVANAHSRVVIIKFGDWSYGLLVDEIIGMRHFPAANKMDLDSAVPDQLRPYIAEAYSGENRTWLVFDIDPLLQDANFMDAAA